MSDAKIKIRISQHNLFKLDNAYARVDKLERIDGVLHHYILNSKGEWVELQSLDPLPNDCIYDVIAGGFLSDAKEAT